MIITIVVFFSLYVDGGLLIVRSCYASSYSSVCIYEPEHIYVQLSWWHNSINASECISAFRLGTTTSSNQNIYITRRSLRCFLFKNAWHISLCLWVAFCESSKIKNNDSSVTNYTSDGSRIFLLSDFPFKKTHTHKQKHVLVSLHQT